MSENDTRTRFVAYYRVSTSRQGQSGLGLEAQRSAVKQFVTQRKGETVAEFTEVETGTGANGQGSMIRMSSLLPSKHSLTTDTFVERRSVLQAGHQQPS
jgi:hypothetical protein